VLTQTTCITIVNHCDEYSADNRADYMMIEIHSHVPQQTNEQYTHTLEHKAHTMIHRAFLIVSFLISSLNVQTLHSSAQISSVERLQACVFGC